MRLKLHFAKDKSHEDVATCIVWTNADEVLSGGDDHQILRWNLLTGERTVACKLPADVYPTHMALLPRQSKSGRHQVPDIIAVTSSDGKFHLLSNAGRIEKSVEAHKGAVLSGKWSFDGNAFITAGEDGQIKVWSRSGMLRSTLVHSQLCVYSVAWSPESDHVLYTYGKELIIKPLQPSGKLISWKAHDGIVLAVDWNSVHNVIISGGEDCRYKVWDSYGRPLYSSAVHDYPVTAISWSYDGNLFAVGSFNSLRLCDKSGWCHGLERTSAGSIMNVAWSDDCTQVAAACFDGKIAFAHCIEKHLQWHEFEAVQISRKTVTVKNVMNDATDTLEMKDRVIMVALGYKHLIIVTTSQCHVYSTSNFNTPSIFELRSAGVSFIKQAQKHFLLNTASGIFVYSYEGRQLCNPKIPGNFNLSLLSYRSVSLSNDVLAVKAGQDDRSVLLFDAVSGRVFGDGTPLVHKLEIQDIHLSKVGSIADRYLALIDKNHDVYLSHVNKDGSEYKLIKLASMVQSLQWNTSVNMLCGLCDSSLKVWFYPPVVFVDPAILSSTIYHKEHNELGKNPLIASYYENTVQVSREDGSLVYVPITSYPAVLHHLVTSGRWNEAVRLCRFAKENTLWACLAAMSVQEKDLATAEIAYAAIQEADKVECIGDIKSIPSKDVRAAEMALFCGSIAEPEAAFLHAGMVYRAIQLNMDLFRWEKALDLALKHKTHVDTVLWFRQIHLQRLNRNENNPKFKKFSQSVDLNWENIKAKIEQDLTC